ncbi:MAG: 1-deoxy-D-xylulose-5-phosphate reductoisomerase [Oxalobacteraceae bacterium]|jgi:1-deoxy-D-xylulose-5-phosphate reductoisomerase|nr:1-deoxy-D-xylulose-5-phosphate reductoisomerase [Oxalobacteraceae bacterium]
MQSLTILGATGSIGVSTLDVVARHPDRYRIFALTGQTRIDVLAEQCAQFHPEVAVVVDADAAERLQKLIRDRGLKTNVVYGEQALCEVASAEACDTVMAAIVGAAGLGPSLAAARAGKKLLLANKEALVISGQLFMDAVAASGSTLLPIDSEHNAIFQCLPIGYQRVPPQHGIRKILLTASGGPFLDRDLSSFESITPEQAVAHPNWSMGRKISVDSATMMNKGLEVIEAHWLFGASASQIEVVIHPQSVIHSMVAYADGSVLAQLGNPDMRTPIAHALAYPERIDSGVDAIDLARIGQLEFRQPDRVRFPCLQLAFDALQVGGSAPAVLNAANEVAVQAFLDNQISFSKISTLIAETLSRVPAASVDTLESLLAQDSKARDQARALLQ